MPEKVFKCLDKVLDNENLTIRLRVCRVSSSESLWGFPSIVAVFHFIPALRAFRPTAQPEPQLSGAQHFFVFLCFVFYKVSFQAFI